MQDEYITYPILEEDLVDRIEDVACLPIYASEIISEIEKNQNRNSNESVSIDQHDNVHMLSSSNYAEATLDNTTGVPEYINDWVKAFIERLNKDHITVENGVEEAITLLFVHAIDNGDIVEGPQSEEYVKDIALKMEFQIMLKGSGVNSLVTKMDIEQLTRDLFGEVIETQTLIKEKKKVNVVASVTDEIKKDSIKKSISDEIVLQPVIQQEDASYEPSVKVESKKKTTVTKDNSTSIVPNGLSVLDALKLNGKYPTKKDEQKNIVPDMFIIDKANKGVPAGENVLFACYTYVAYCSMAKVKPTKNLTMKLPFLDNNFRVFVITDSSIVLSSSFTSEKDAIVVPRKEVIGVTHVFEKKFSSVGQTQILLNSGNIIVITIDKVIGGTPDQNQFDAFKVKIDGLLGQQGNESTNREDAYETNLDSNNEHENSILKRKASLETFKGMLLELEQYQILNISTIDRLVAVVLVETIIELMDKYIASEEKNYILFIIQESCVNRKLNDLLQDDMFGFVDINDFNADGNLPTESFEDIKAIEKDYSEYLDELMKDAREHYIKVLKNL